jgi:hypothetical protein
MRHSWHAVAEGPELSFPAAEGITPLTRPAESCSGELRRASCADLANARLLTRPLGEIPFVRAPSAEALPDPLTARRSLILAPPGAESLAF